MKKIELIKEHRGGVNSTSFTGRNEGALVRSKLGLTSLDKDNENYVVVMPNDTTSFNPSFYLGLFYKSINFLKWQKFSEKYVFDLSNFSEDLRNIIQRNLEECERKAKNELNGLTGLDV